MNTKPCTCGRCPSIRMENGLAPFCQLPTPARRTPEGFRSYSEAIAACKPGQSVRAVGGLGTGSPTRFVLVG